VQEAGKRQIFALQSFKSCHYLNFNNTGAYRILARTPSIINVVGFMSHPPDLRLDYRSVPLIVYLCLHRVEGYPFMKLFLYKCSKTKQLSIESITPLERSESIDLKLQDIQIVFVHTAVHS
jgi:hypothetical protein